MPTHPEKFHTIKKTESMSQLHDFVFCGYGKLIWPDGSYFEGYWVNGKGHGFAFFKAATGEEYSGEWVFDPTTQNSVFRNASAIELKPKEQQSNP